MALRVICAVFLLIYYIDLQAKEPDYWNPIKLKLQNLSNGSTLWDDEARKIYQPFLYDIFSSEIGQSYFCHGIEVDEYSISNTLGIFYDEAQHIKQVCGKKLSPLVINPDTLEFQKILLPRSFRFIAQAQNTFRYWAFSFPSLITEFYFHSTTTNWEEWMRNFIHELAITYDGKITMTPASLNYFATIYWQENSANLSKPVTDLSQLYENYYLRFSKHSQFIKTCDVLVATGLPVIRMALASIRAWEVEDLVQNSLNNKYSLPDSKTPRPYTTSDSCWQKVVNTAAIISDWEVDVNMLAQFEYDDYVSGVLERHACLTLIPPALQAAFVEGKIAMPVTPGLPQYELPHKGQYKKTLDFLSDIKLQSASGKKLDLCDFLTHHQTSQNSTGDVKTSLEIGLSIMTMGPRPRILGGSGP